MSDTDSTYQNYVALIGALKEALNVFVNGGLGQFVDTDGGPVPCIAQIAKAVSDRGGSPTFKTTAEGIAGTLEGGFFKVPSPEPLEAEIIYQHLAGGVADEVARTSNEKAVEEVQARIDASSTQMLGNLAYLPKEVSGLPIEFSVDSAGKSARLLFEERDEAALSSTKTTYYVGFDGASDLNDGLSEATSINNLATLFQDVIGTPDSDVEVILGPGLYGKGIYYRSDTTKQNGVAWVGDYHLSIRAHSVPVLLTSAENPNALSWVSEGGIYKAARSGVEAVYDASKRDYRGVPTKLEMAASVEECETTPGSWFTDNVDVWVHHLDGHEPDPETLVILRLGNTIRYTMTPRSGKMVFLENVSFCLRPSDGDRDGLTVSVPDGDEGYFSAIGCGFIGAPHNGIDTNKVTLAYLRDCTSAFNGLDGFNYHDTLGAPQGAIIEVGCHGYGNGDPENGGTQNGSTAHDGITIVRVNCLHYENYGPCIADVNGCFSFNVNCWAGRSTRPEGPTSAGFYFNETASAVPGKAWLVACGGSDSYYDLSSDGQSEILIRGWKGGKVEPNTNPQSF